MGWWAFSRCTNLTSVTIGNSVPSIESGTFSDCTSLTSVTIPDSVTSIGYEAFSGCTSLTIVTIPNSVTNMGWGAFENCTNLTNVTIPASVTGMGDIAFGGCTRLTAVHFAGDAPILVPRPQYAWVGAFAGDTNSTVYHLPRTTGWETTFDGLPTAVWKPEVESRDSSFGVRTNQFGFNIVWGSGMTVVVEACTNLARPVWVAVSTNVLASGMTYFSDPEWTKYPSRFYRVRSY